MSRVAQKQGLAGLCSGVFPRILPGHVANALHGYRGTHGEGGHGHALSIPSHSYTWPEISANKLDLKRGKRRASPLRTMVKHRPTTMDPEENEIKVG
eukprot:g35016.t1